MSLSQHYYRKEDFILIACSYFSFQVCCMLFVSTLPTTFHLRSHTKPERQTNEWYISLDPFIIYNFIKSAEIDSSFIIVFFPLSCFIRIFVSPCCVLCGTMLCAEMCFFTICPSINTNSGPVTHSNCIIYILHSHFLFGRTQFKKMSWSQNQMLILPRHPYMAEMRFSCFWDTFESSSNKHCRS